MAAPEEERRQLLGMEGEEGEGEEEEEGEKGEEEEVVVRMVRWGGTVRRKD